MKELLSFGKINDDILFFKQREINSLAIKILLSKNFNEKDFNKKNEEFLKRKIECLYKNR